jgi:hypothetical protein
MHETGRVVVNRAVLLRKYKMPTIKWINDADTYNSDSGISLEVVNEERTVSLITDDDTDGPDAVDRRVKKNWRNLFEIELEGRYKKPDLWPNALTLKLFRQWFTVEHHTVMHDTVGGKIFYDSL